MKRVLIIDDEPEICSLYAAELGDDGYDVSWAQSGSQAREVLRRDPRINLVVLDIHMDQSDGFEMLEYLRIHHPDVIVVLNSAYSHYKDDFMSWLADAYVVKSPDLTELKGTVRDLLAVRDSASQ